MTLISESPTDILRLYFTFSTGDLVILRLEEKLKRVVSVSRFGVLLNEDLGTGLKEIGDVEGTEVDLGVGTL